MLENMKLFLVLNRVPDSLVLLTREISWSTLEINFIFPHTHVLFSIHHSQMYKAIDNLRFNEIRDKIQLIY